MENRRHTVDSVFTLVLFAIFTLMALLVTAAGVSAYSSASARSEQRFSRQTCLGYITAKVRSYNEVGAVSLTKVGDCDALTFAEEINGDLYLTSIYCFEGQIMELMRRSDIDIGPEGGMPVCPAKGLSFAFDGGCLQITLTDTDDTTATAVAACITG